MFAKMSGRRPTSRSLPLGGGSPQGFGVLQRLSWSPRIDSGGYGDPNSVGPLSLLVCRFLTCWLSVTSVIETTQTTETTTAVEVTIETTIETSTQTATETVIETTTEAPAINSSQAPAVKRALEYPEWLPSAYITPRVQSACYCLSPPQSTTTTTFTAGEVTITDSTTTTEPTTTTDTLTSTQITAEVTTTTETPTTTITETIIETIIPEPMKRQFRIEILRADTGLPVGYIYDSSGPAITNLLTAATRFHIRLPIGQTSATSLDILVEGMGNPSKGLGFNYPSSRELENFCGSCSLVSTQYVIIHALPKMIPPQRLSS